MNDLQKISKYFIIFETVDECFSDLKQKFDDNNYEIILNNINEKITIKIKTNIANKDFNLDIPVKKLEEEKIYNKFIYSNLKQNLNYLKIVLIKLLIKKEVKVKKEMKILKKLKIKVKNYLKSLQL